jgi:hypothetical protein
VLTLVVAALLAGVAGSWSPCGLSMVETLQRARWGAATFAAGALAGGAITFGGLALLGEALGAGGAAAAYVAVAVLAVCALGDAAGRRIVPQVRRQVPESWRRILPLPAAAALYGVLLGLGFTTFLLTFATWALAAACLAVGTPATGLAVGLAFGAGRALPVAVLSVRDEGAAAIAARPDVLRGLRGATAAALLAAAIGLAAAPPAARAERTVADGAYDPSASGALLAYQPRSGNGVLVRPQGTVTLPGTHPSVSGSEVAWVQDSSIVVADAATLVPMGSIPAPGADAVALSASHIAWRSGDAILAVARAAPADVLRVRTGTVGRPTLYGSRVAFDEQSRSQSRLLERDLTRSRVHTLRRATGAQLLAPTRTDLGLLFVRASSRRQKLMLGSDTIFSTTPTARRDDGEEPGHGPHHQGYPHGRRPKDPERPRPGLTVTLWTTALAGDHAYVTRLRHLRGGRTRSRILRVGV